MSTEEQKFQQDEAANGPRIITSQAIADNELTPPLGTMYFGHQTIAFMTDCPLIPPYGEPTEWGRASWNADVYTYGTGGVAPTDPNFATEGGLIYIVMIHRVNFSIDGAFSADSWCTMAFGMSKNETLTSVYQLPSTGTEQVLGYNYNYEIDFLQGMQTPRNQGNQAITFDAKCSQSFSLEQAKQMAVASLRGVGSEIQTSSNSHRVIQTCGLSVFTASDPSRFPFEMGYSFGLKGNGPTAFADQSANFTLDLKF